jgi:hypothetical protein
MIKLASGLSGLILLCLLACRPANSPNLPSQDVTFTLLQLKAEKDLLDSLAEKNQSQLTLYGRWRDTDSLVVLDPLEWNPEIMHTFLPVVDSLGRIRAVTESPVSESGDWVITYTHYFDSSGKTFAFERKTGFFNSICTDDLALELTTQFFAPDGVQLDSTYYLSDKAGNPLQRSECQFPYDYPYSIYRSQESYWTAQRLPPNP